MRARLARALAVIAAALLIAVGMTVPAQAASGPAGDVFTSVNQHRANAGLPALVTDPTLDNAAWQWANYLATTNQFFHSSADWRASMISGAGWIHSGENIAAGQSSASSVMTAWMGSSGHRANILNPNYVGMGVAYVYIAGSQYGHYWVQIFAASQQRVPAGNAPAVTGSTTVGGTLTASATGWGGASLSWSWQSNGVTIPGATGSTYKPNISDANRRITATVTGSMSGYYPTSKTSGQTAAISGGPQSQRISGSDRYATAVEISKAGFSAGVGVAFVASGANFPDALGAAPAATLGGGPLLLTPTDSLPVGVANELRRLAPAKIVVVGGAATISAGVIAQLQTIAPTTRLAGDDRFETSREIVAASFTSSSVAYLATGFNFPDALTASAAAGSADAPVILVNGNESADAATIALLRSLGVTTVRLAGSTGVLSPSLQSSLSSAGFTVQRLSGANRYETANAINLQAFTSAPTVYLASGEAFPDALAGAALAGAGGAPLFVSTSACIPQPVSQAITSLGVSRVVLLGGSPALNPNVATFLRCA